MKGIEQTRAILERVSVIEKKITYHDEIAQLVHNTKELNPLAEDVKKGQELRVSKNFFIVYSIPVPPHIQGLHIEEARLRFLLERLSPEERTLPEFADAPRKLGFVLTFIRKWREGRVSQIPSLMIRIGIGIHFDYVFGEDWKIHVIAKR